MSIVTDGPDNVRPRFMQPIRLLVKFRGDESIWDSPPEALGTGKPGDAALPNGAVVDTNGAVRVPDLNGIPREVCAVHWHFEPCSRCGRGNVGGDWSQQPQPEYYEGVPGEYTPWVQVATVSHDDLVDLLFLEGTLPVEIRPQFERAVKSAKERYAESPEAKEAARRLEIDGEKYRKEIRRVADEELQAEREAYITSPEGMANAAAELGQSMYGDLTLLPQPEWLIDGWVMKSSAARTVARTGSFKSFVQLSKMAALATGTPWYGHRTRQTNVLAVLAEGQAGTAAREDALLKHRREALGLAPGERLPNIHWLPMALNLADPEMVRKTIAYVKAHEIGYVSIDTQGRSFVGVNENDASEMNEVFSNIDLIVRETGATVELVHHTGVGKPEDGEMIRGRGTGAIKDNIENEMVITREGRETSNDRIVISSAKVRDGAPREDLILYPLEIALDVPRGDLESSLVLVTGDERMTAPNPPAHVVARRSEARPDNWNESYMRYVNKLSDFPKRGLTKTRLAEELKSQLKNIGKTLDRAIEYGFIERKGNDLFATELGRQGVRFERARGVAWEGPAEASAGVGRESAPQPGGAE